MLSIQRRLRFKLLKVKTMTLALRYSRPTAVLNLPNRSSQVFCCAMRCLIATASGLSSVSAFSTAATMPTALSAKETTPSAE